MEQELLTDEEIQEVANGDGYAYLGPGVKEIIRKVVQNKLDKATPLIEKRVAQEMVQWIEEHNLHDALTDEPLEHWIVTRTELHNLLARYEGE